MKYVKHVIVALLLVLATGILMGNACSDAAEKVCGPCPDPAEGGVYVTGDAEVDGFLNAVATLQQRTSTIKTNFDGRVRAMAEGVFGIDVEGKTTAAIVGEIKTAYSAWISANVEGSVSVQYQPPKCEANVNVSVKAQAKCEAQAGCTVEAECDPGKLSFECSGTCEGSCEGECSVPSCEVQLDPGTLACSGTCSGECAASLDVAAACNGTCEGSCSGECSAYDGAGNCKGTCSGNCQGKCVAKADGKVQCSGQCRGSCVVENPSAEVTCKGELGCSGSCSGRCSGGCEGEVKAPKCEGSAECDASAKCDAQASAQASASVECTPPSLDLGYNFKAGVDAAAQADFIAKLEKFKVEMIGIVKGNADLRALVDADYAAEIGLEQPPVKAIATSMGKIVTKLTSGELEFENAQSALCAADGFEKSITLLGSIGTDMQATITAQLDLMALII